MTKLPRRDALLVLIPAALALAGCQTQTQATASRPGAFNDADLDFVANAQNIILFDREECVAAETRARTPQVRALAAKLLADANAFDARLQPVLRDTGIAPPAVLRSDLRVRLGHMRLDRGLDFDRTFLNDQIQTHEELINRQEMMASGPPMNPRITELALAGSQILKRNLEELRTLQRTMTSPSPSPFSSPSPSGRGPG